VSRAAASAASEHERDRTYLQAEVTAPLAVATFQRAEPPFARALQSARARTSPRYSQWDGALGERARDAVAALLAGRRTLSPTALESYARCPQQFLMGELLHVRAVEEPERTVRIDNLRRGSLFHRIFERFHGEWGGPGPAALDPSAQARMSAIAREECDAAEQRGETGYRAMWAADRLEVGEDCMRWLDVEREDPLTRQLAHGACEARFGPPRPGEQSGTLSQDEPLEIALDAHALRLAGRIDRIQWDTRPPTRFRVIDYKSGKVSGERPAELQGGRMLQLPLYVLAGARLLGADARAGEAVYAYATRRGDFKTIGWSSGELHERHDQLTALLTAILDGVAAGEFMVAPWKEDACEHCAFKAICPAHAGAYAKRKQEDPRLARLHLQIRSVP
jgi:ATP-dependent helicase/DNAse subunit B